jgi:hypothetical protein
VIDIRDFRNEKARKDNPEEGRPRIGQISSLQTQPRLAQTHFELFKSVAMVTNKFLVPSSSISLSTFAKTFSSISRIEVRVSILSIPRDASTVRDRESWEDEGGRKERRRDENSVGGTGGGG